MWRAFTVHNFPSDFDHPQLSSTQSRVSFQVHKLLNGEYEHPSHLTASVKGLNRTIYAIDSTNSNSGRSCQSQTPTNPAIGGDFQGRFRRIYLWPFDRFFHCHISSTSLYPDSAERKAFRGMTRKLWVVHLYHLRDQSRKMLMVDGSSSNDGRKPEHWNAQHATDLSQEIFKFWHITKDHPWQHPWETLFMHNNLSIVGYRRKGEETVKEEFIGKIFLIFPQPSIKQNQMVGV